MRTSYYFFTEFFLGVGKSGLDRVCLGKEIDPDYQLILKDFESNFDILYEKKWLNMTLKIHVIIHHIDQYFQLTNTTMRDTNGEFVENLHSSLRTHEENHGYKVVRRLGTPSHLKLAHESLVTFNSLKAGHSPAHELMIRKSSPHCQTPGR